MLLNNKCVNNEIKGEKNQKLTWDKWKWEDNDPKSMGHRKSHPKREIYSNTGIPQETRKILNNLSNLIPKRTTIKAQI